MSKTKKCPQDLRDVTPQAAKWERKLDAKRDRKEAANAILDSLAEWGE